MKQILDIQKQKQKQKQKRKNINHQLYIYDYIVGITQFSDIIEEFENEKVILKKIMYETIFSETLERNFENGSYVIIQSVTIKFDTIEKMVKFYKKYKEKYISFLIEIGGGFFVLGYDNDFKLEETNIDDLSLIYKGFSYETILENEIDEKIIKKIL